MSLIRRMWWVVVAALGLAGVGGLGVCLSAARDAAQSQVQRENAAGAGALALALSQLQGDPAAMAALLAAQFDTGRYRTLRLTARDGTVLFERDGAAPLAGLPERAPGWFAALLPLDSPSAAAPVSAGGRPIGAVQLAGHSGAAQAALWHAGVRAALTFAVLAAGAALLARASLHALARALEGPLRQARALLEGRFVTARAPHVEELDVLTRAMNAMVGRLQQDFQAQAEQVEVLRRQAHTDPLTGLAARAHFLRRLVAMLEGEDGAPAGGLVLLRVQDLARLNRERGHAATDGIIAALAQALQAYTGRVPGCCVGRLNGADFALALPAGGVARETAEAVAQALGVALPAFGHGVSVALGAVETRRGVPAATLLAAADAALARAETQGPFAVVADEADAGAGGLAALGETAWRERLGEALAAQRLQLAESPVLDAGAGLLHLDGSLRVQLEPDGPHEPPARWLPLALRARVTPALDEQAVGLALEAIARDGVRRAVVLAGASLAEPAFLGRLRARLTATPQAAAALSLELPESWAVDHFDTVRGLAAALHGTGVELGLDQAGERLARLPRLVESGIAYVKLDAATVQGLAGDAGRARYVGGLVALLHGASRRVIAGGVADPADAELLWALGVDGVSGPWAGARRPPPVPAPG